MRSAKVVIAFPGVEDGQVYPRMIQEGETITGDLAEVAIRDGFAEDLAAKPAKKADTKADAKS